MLSLVGQVDVLGEVYLHFKDTNLHEAFLSHDVHHVILCRSYGPVFSGGYNKSAYPLLLKLYQPLHAHALNLSG